MRALERRLQQLEAASALHVCPEVARLRAEAMASVFDVLYDHYPDEPWTSANLSVGRKTASLKIAEAACRVASGQPMEIDLRALAAFPASALAAFNATPEEMLTAVGGVLAKF